MQRKKEISSTIFAGTAETRANTAHCDLATPPAPTPETESISFHYLLKRANGLGAVPSGFIQVRDKHGILIGTRTDKIPSDRMPDFLEQIAKGRVYVYWAQHVEHMDELGPEWHLACRKRFGQTPTQRLRSTRRARPVRVEARVMGRAALPVDE